jgi:NAD(P)-dependent dehydrogenase (short-subunit alcohol dehydrogenase family)
MPTIDRPPVAVVTGGTRSIGAAIVDRLLADGWRVVVGYASDDRTAKAFVKERPDVAVVRSDVSTSAGCVALIETAVAQFGGLDHVVHNAGITRDAAIADLTDEEWDAVIATNLGGAFRLARAAVDVIAASQRGRIVCISSVAALMGNAGQGAYAASKAGLTGLVRTLARELAASGTTVNVVVPGPIEDSGMTGDTNPDFTAAIRRKIPLGRLGRVDEVAHAVRFLLDDQAAFITGSIVTVDGGLSM